MNSMLRKAALAISFVIAGMVVHGQAFNPHQINWPTGAAGCVYAPGTNTCVAPGPTPANALVKTGNYTVTATGIVVMNCSSACTITLPSTVATGFGLQIQRTGAGAVTINPNGVTYFGTTTIPLQGEFVFITTDGTNYYSSWPFSVDSSLNASSGPYGIQLSVAAGAGSTICADTSGSPTVQSCTIAGFTLSSPKCFTYTTTTANTGASLTLNINSGGAKPIAKWLGVTSLAAGDVPANKAEVVCYDGTNINLMTVGNVPSGGGAPSGTGVPQVISGSYGTTVDMGTTPGVPLVSDGSHHPTLANGTLSTGGSGTSVLSLTTTTIGGLSGLTGLVSGQSVVEITDASACGDTSTGGGSITEFLRYNGSGWNIVSCSASATGSGVLIAEQVLTSAASNFTFSSIPSTYRDLILRCNARGDATQTNIQGQVQLNGDTGSDYDNVYSFWNSSGASYFPQTGTTSLTQGVGAFPGASSAANYPGNFEMTIQDYKGTIFYKNVSWRSGFVNGSIGSGNLYVANGTGWWRNTTAITGVLIKPDSGNFITGSRCSLYGSY